MRPELSIPLRLLENAVDLCWSSPDPEERAESLERAAALAVELGAYDRAVELLLDLPEPAGRAWLWCQLAEAHTRSPGGRERALAHLQAATRELSLPGRWRPRPGWLNPDLARVDLADRALRLGELELVQQLSEGVGRGASARAALAVVLALGPMASGDAGWAQARMGIGAVEDEVEARELRVELAGRAVLAGEWARVPGLWTEGGMESGLLAEELARVLFLGGHRESAAELVDRAAARLGAEAPQGPATELRCRLAALLDDEGEREAALRIVQAAVVGLGRPLPPDPDTTAGWSALTRLCLERASLSQPLRELLREQEMLSSGWCYALGRMELSLGRRDRARQAAHALDQGMRQTEEPEAQLHAALLWLELGELERAREPIRRLRAGPECALQLPGGLGGPGLPEQWLVPALLLAGEDRLALDVARGLRAGPLRRELLLRCAECCGDDDEAALILEEGLRSAPGLLGLLGREPLLLRAGWRPGAEEIRRVLRWGLEPERRALALLARQLPSLDPLVEGALEELAGLEPRSRCERCLDWLADRWAPQR